MMLNTTLGATTERREISSSEKNPPKLSASLSNSAFICSIGMKTAIPPSSSRRTVLFRERNFIRFGRFSINLFREESLLPVISALPALALHFAIMIIFLLMLGRQIDFIRFMKFDFWPTAIMQVILAYPVHRIVHALNEYSKQRR